MIKDHSFYYRGGDLGILLIHGLTGTPTEVRGLGRGLHEAGHTVLGVQLAGHGGDEADLLRTGWREWYASVAAAHARLAGEVDSVAVVGLSMGAVLALHLAAERPDGVGGLALLSTTLAHDGWSLPAVARLSFLVTLADRLGFAHGRRFIEREPFGIRDERLRRMVAARMAAGDGATGLLANPWPSLAEFYRLVRLVRGEVGRVRVPALIVHSLADDIASPENALFLQRRLAGEVHLVFLRSSYHMITLDRERALVLDHVRRFLATLRRPATIDAPEAPFVVAQPA